jgi:outer membrane protein W
MKRSSLLLLTVLAVLPARAAEIEAAIHHVIAMPYGDSGDLDIPPGRGFSASGEVFFSDRYSAQGTALFVNPEAILYPSSSPGKDVDLGTIGIDLYFATARMHFGGTTSGFSGFIGAGAGIAVLGNLDDQFGDEVEATFDNETVLVAEGGVRYQVHPRIAIDLSAAFVPLEGETKVGHSAYPLPEKVGIDPLIVSLGASWRF